MKNDKIDQVEGYEKAIEAFFKKIVVTVTGHRAFEAKRLWEMGQAFGVEPIIFSVHNTALVMKTPRSWRNIAMLYGPVPQSQLGK